MSDGALPNARVRETVLRLLHQLPVDCRSAALSLLRCPAPAAPASRLPSLPLAAPAWAAPFQPLPDAAPTRRVLPCTAPVLPLPCPCSMEDRKEQLKKSGLGRIIMFLFKLPGGLILSALIHRSVAALAHSPLCAQWRRAAMQRRGAAGWRGAL